jgi:hypothetical protein
MDQVIRHARILRSEKGISFTGLASSASTANAMNIVLN